MKEGKVSVIIPVYNVVKYLQQCIESVLMQTYKNYEIILIDDGSTDGSGKICDQYERKNIIIIHQKNKGVSAARNVGIGVARGDYIMFVDADDVIEGDTLSLLVETGMKYGSPDVVIAELDTMPKGNKIVWRDDFFEFISLNEFWSPCAKLFKRNKINFLFDERVYIAEDLWFCYQNRKSLKNFVYLPRKLYRYRQNKKSAMKKREVNATDLSCLDVVLQIIGNPELSEDLRLFFMAYYIKAYYFIFSKKFKDKIGKAEKRWYGRYIDKFYREVKNANMLDVKLFTQAKLTPIYNLHSKLKR